MKKIFIVGSNYMNYADALCQVLIELGYNIELFKLEFFERNTLSGLDLLKAYINKEYVQRDYYQCKIEKLKASIVEADFDVFIYFNGRAQFDYMNEDIFNLIKGKGAKSIVWYMDSIKSCKDTNKTLKYYDEIYSFEKDDVEYYRLLGIKVNYLPIGVDTSIYCNGVTEKADAIYDLCFVGGATTNRLTTLENIAKYAYENSRTMMIYGGYWYNKNKFKERWERYKFKKKYPYLYEYVHNKNIPPVEAAELYMKSKICLNIHTSIHNGCNPRTFEILGNGNFELCDYREDFEVLGIKDGEHLAIYNSIEECIEKIDYYLNEDLKREQIGISGKRLVSEKYTMKEFVRRGMCL